MDAATNGLDEQTSSLNKSNPMLNKIEHARQARRNKFYLRDEHITLSHGSGGKATHNLIEGIFAPAFSNPLLDRLDDAAVFMPGNGNVRMAFTTDTYVVNPLFFPGGDRQTGSARHHQRSGNGRRATPLSLGRLHLRGRLSDG